MIGDDGLVAGFLEFVEGVMTFGEVKVAEDEEVIVAIAAVEFVEEGDLVIFTKGDLTGVSGGTNSMKIVTVASSD